MKKLYTKLISLGIHDQLTRSETKITKLLNQLCFTWCVLLIFFIITDLILLDNFIPTVSGHVVMGLLLSIVFVFQKYGKTNTARMLFILSAFGEFYVFANYFMPGQLVELFYVLIPLFSILLFHQKWIHYSWLFISIITFIIPNKISPIYDNGLFADPTTVPIFFVGVFLIVVYFKNMNLSNEARLEEQKDTAEKATKIIDNQKQELENIYHQQKQFFVNVAHEIRTPLTIINGNNNIINSQHDLKESSIIKAQVTKIKQIVDDVLDLAKLDSNEFVLQKISLNLITLINQIKDSFNASFEQKSIDFNFVSTTDTPAFVEADNLYLQRAINNLLSNALKYTPEEGNVKIELRTKQNNIEISISDTGIGIDDTEKSLIFNRFYQANNSINKAGGSGIGLSFTKEIIEQHGGTIQVRSQTKGSCFVISLPTTETHEVSTETQLDNQVEKLIPATNHGNKQVLVVEDNSDMAEYIGTVLTDYTILHAKDGLEGLQVIKENTSIDLIITDYMMPHLNGYDFICKLREIDNHLPIIMLTAKSDINTKLEVLRLGIDDVIAKPFEAEELLIKAKNSIVNNESKQNFIQQENIPLTEIYEDTWINGVSEFIDKNCADSTLSISTLCEEFAMSSSTLLRKIKSQTGLSTKEFITEVRLQKAQQLLTESSNLSLNEIGAKTGFKNTTRFKKLYTERFGVIQE